MAADSTTDNVVTWQVITGSARGATHRASGLPGRGSQPARALRCRRRGRRRARSHPPFRSADGAALAVDVACRAGPRVAIVLAADDTDHEEALPPGAHPAFTAGLHDASLNGRVTEGTWRRLLLGLHDCCWNGSAPLPVPVTLRLRGSPIVLSEDAVLTSHHLNRDHDYRTACAVVEPDPRQPGRSVLRNLTGRTWTVVPDGEEPKRWSRTSGWACGRCASISARPGARSLGR